MFNCRCATFGHRVKRIQLIMKLLPSNNNTKIYSFFNSTWWKYCVDHQGPTVRLQSAVSLPSLCRFRRFRCSSQVIVLVSYGFLSHFSLLLLLLLPFILSFPREEILSQSQCLRPPSLPSALSSPASSIVSITPMARVINLFWTRDSLNMKMSDSRTHSHWNRSSEFFGFSHPVILCHHSLYNKL